MSANQHKHIEFVITLHCQVCGDVSSLSVLLSKGEASDKLNEYINAHRHETGMWIA